MRIAIGRPFCLSVFVWWLAGGAVEGAPILVAGFQATNSFGFNSNYQFEFQNAQLSYALNSNGFGSPCLGCEYLPTVGTTGLSEYTASTTTDFLPFTSELTNNFDQLLYVFPGIYSSTGSIVGGGGPVKIESQWVGGSLEGAQIDLVRRWILVNAVTFRPDAGQVDFRVVTQWEFWRVNGGTIPPPSPADLTPVPEPSSLLLIASGAAFALRRRCRAASIRWTR